MEDFGEVLRRPANPTTAASRTAALLSENDEFVFAAMTLGDIIYDRISIDGVVLKAFDFAHKPNLNNIYELAIWSQRIIKDPSWTYEGNVSRLQGYVFERMAALSLRHSGAVVDFPEEANNPGWDFTVNGEQVQAKCGVSSKLVTEHLQKYPNIPRVIVNEDLATHFANNDYVTAVPGVTRDAVRSTTEHSLHSAADMLDFHLGDVVPAMSVARNAYQLWRGNTDWRALLGNVPLDSVGRLIGGTAGHAIGGTLLALGLVGWPAILLPLATATAGYRGGRILSNELKKRIYLRTEYAALSEALRRWCEGASGVLSKMIHQAERTENRIAAARERAHPDYRVVFEDWQQRLAAEQSFRRLHVARFNSGASDPSIFGGGSGLLEACPTAMVAASRAGILPADLVPEKKSLITAITNYLSGLRRRLLSR